MVVQKYLFFLTLILLAQSVISQLPDSGILFNGTSNHYEVQDNSSIDLNGSFTIEVWINPCDTINRFILTKGWCSGNQYSYYWHITNGRLRWAWKAVGGCSATTISTYDSPLGLIRNNQWQHVALVHTPTSVTLYRNGVPVAGSLTSGTYGSIFNSTEPLRVAPYKFASGTLGNFYIGRMDELRIWSTARTSAQILANYNSTLIGNETGLQLYHNMETVRGDTIFNSATATGAINNGRGVSWSPQTIHNNASYPAAFDLGNDTILCGPINLSLSMPLGFSRYLWDNSSTTRTRTVNSAGTYSGQVFQSQCSSSDTINLFSISGVTVFGRDTTLCPGDSLLLDATTPSANYLWSTGDTVPSIAVNSAGSYWVRVGVGGCFFFDTINVFIGRYPIVDLGPDTLVCNDQFTFDAGTSGFQYLWDDGSISRFNTYLTSGLKWVEVTNGNCSTRDSVNVSLIDLRINLGNDTTLCPGDSLLLDATSLATNYLWSTGDTSAIVIINTPGTYWVRAQLGACFFFDTINVVFSTFPLLNLGNDTLICSSQYSLDAGASRVSYLWQDGTTLRRNSTTSSGLKWVEVSNGFCSTRDSIRVSLVDLTFDLGRDTILCEGSSFLLNPNVIAKSYLWNNGATTQTISVNTNGFYSLSITDSICSFTDSVLIGFQRINSVISAIPLSGCAPLEVQFTNSSSVNVGSVTAQNWNFGDGGVSAVSNPNHVYSNPGSYSVSLRVTSNLGCEKDTSISNYITVFPVPVSNFTINSTPSFIGDAVNFSNQSSNSTSYIWTFDGEVVSNATNWSNNFGSAGIFNISLIANNVFGCSDTITKQLTVNTGNVLFIPNSFSPNDDGLNDEWNVVTNANLLNYNLLIFNRWGELIFSTTSPTEGWDGTFNALDCPNDTYVWKVTLTYIDGVTEEKIGHINLVK